MDHALPGARPGAAAGCVGRRAGAVGAEATAPPLLAPVGRRVGARRRRGGRGDLVAHAGGGTRAGAEPQAEWTDDRARADTRRADVHGAGATSLVVVAGRRLPAPRR